jgi:hypothetical protein
MPIPIIGLKDLRMNGDVPAKWQHSYNKKALSRRPHLGESLAADGAP